MMRIFGSLIVILMASLFLACLVGCGGSGATLDPSDDGAVADIVVGPVDETTGTVTFSVGEDIVGTYDPETGDVKVESVTSRWPDWKVLRVRFYDVTDGGKLLGTAYLTPSNPSGSVQGIPGGHQVRADATLYFDTARTQVITTGTSDTKTVPPGGSVQLRITLTATKPVLTVVAPLDGATVNKLPADTVLVRIKAVDLGAGIPSVSLTDNGVDVGAYDTVTGDSSAAGRVFTWNLNQGKGDHAMVATFRSTSHLSATNSGIRQVSWSYEVVTDGNVNVIVENVGS